MFTALITLLTALAISAVAAYVSVTGMMALFPAAAMTVMVLMGSIEVGKLVGASWLKLNWTNKTVNRAHKYLLTVLIVVIMGITSLGMYGFLSKGYLEQSTPIAGVALEISQKEQSIKMLELDNERLQKKIDQLDANISAFLKGDKAERANSVLNRQKRERADIEKELKTNNEQIKALHAEILPLKVQTAGVEAKLGPIKYIARLFNWEDPVTAVNMVIMMLIFVSDPLAVLLLLSAQVSFLAWMDKRKKPEPVETPIEEPKPALAMEFGDLPKEPNEETKQALEEARELADAFLNRQVDTVMEAPVEEPTPEPIAEKPKSKRGGNRRKPKVVEQTPTPTPVDEQYQKTLKRVAAVYSGQAELPLDPEESAAEKHPELLGTQVEKPKVQVPESEVTQPSGDSKSKTLTTDVPQEQLARNLKSASWLTRPKR